MLDLETNTQTSGRSGGRADVIVNVAEGGGRASPKIVLGIAEAGNRGCTVYEGKRAGRATWRLLVAVARKSGRPYFERSEVEPSSFADAYRCICPSALAPPSQCNLREDRGAFLRSCCGAPPKRQIRKSAC